MGAVFYIQIDFLGNLWYTIKNNYGGFHGETQISHTAAVGADEKRHYGGQRHLAGGQRHFLSGYVYLKRFTSREELVSAIEEYIRFYNTRRYQKRLNCMTPCEYYFATAV